MLLSEKHYFSSSSSYFYSILYGVHMNFLFTKESFVNNSLPQQIVFFSLSFFFFLGEGVIFGCLFCVAFFLFPSFFCGLFFFYVLLLCVFLLDHSEGSWNKKKNQSVLALRGKSLIQSKAFLVIKPIFL